MPVAFRRNRLFFVSLCVIDNPGWKKAGLSSILFVLVLLAVGVIAEAQQPTKVPRIGVLSNRVPTRASDAVPRLAAG